MCLPALAIGAILAAGGMGAQYLGQEKADHALSSTFNAERQRQHDFEAQQQGKFQDSLSSAGNMASPEAQAAAATNRETALDAVIKNADPVASGYLPTAGSAPQIVANAGAAAGAKAGAATSSLAKAMAAMGGFGDLMQQNAINLNRNNQSIDQIGGFMRGSLGALQPEMDAAKLKGGNLRALGGLAQSIGSAMMGGAAGGGAGGAWPVGINTANTSLIPAGGLPGLSGMFA